MATLFPARDAGLAMGRLAELVDHYRIQPQLWQAFIDKCGDPLDDLRMLAALPPMVITEACAVAVLPDGASLTAIQASQIGLVYRLARRILHTRAGGDWETWEDQDPWSVTTTPPTSRTPSTTTTTATSSMARERKLKMTQVLDQADDSEFVVETETVRSGWLQRVITLTYRCTSTGGGRADLRASKCLAQEVDTTGLGPLHRFWSVGAIRSKSFEGIKVQVLHPDGRGVHHQGTSGALLLSSVESLFQSFLNGMSHAEHRRSSSTTRLRDVRGETFKTISGSMAPHLPGRRPSKKQPHHQDEDSHTLGHQKRKCPAKTLGCCEAVERYVQNVAIRRGLLEGAGAWACSGMVGVWRKGETPDPSRSLRSRALERRVERGQTGGREDRWRGRWRRSRQEERKQGEERSKKEEDRLRARRVGKIPKALRWRSERKRKSTRRKGRQQGLPEVFWVEQRQWTLCESFTWTTMCVKSQEGAQVHDMRFARTPKQGLSAKEMNLVSFGLWGLVMKFAKKVGGSEKEESENTYTFSPVPKENTDRKDKKDEDRRDEGEKRKKEREDGRDRGEPGDQSNEAALRKYTENRTFLFIHHFSGARGDRLGDAISAEAKKYNMKVKIVNADKEDREGNDLAGDMPFREHLRLAREGKVDGYHSGFPCTTFSRLRWRRADNMPGPVRSKEYPYGLPSNTPAEQKECDMGTVLAARSIDMAVEVEAHRSDLLSVGPFSTLENPPESNVEGHLSAWEMKEMEKYLNIPGVKNANFHTCAYQKDIIEGQRSFKPQRFAGSLLGMPSFSRHCTCSDNAKHIPIIGKERSSAAAEYPVELCVKYAQAAITHFKLLAKQEFWSDRKKKVEAEVEELKKKEVRGTKRKAEEIEGRNPGGTASSSRPEGAGEWRGGDGKFEMMRDNLRKSEKPNMLDFVGGMRDPAKVVEHHPAMANWGVEIWSAWCKFVRKYERALQVAKQYGTKECSFERDLVER